MRKRIGHAGVRKACILTSKHQRRKRKAATKQNVFAVKRGNDDDGSTGTLGVRAAAHGVVKSVLMTLSRP